MAEPGAKILFETAPNGDLLTGSVEESMLEEGDSKKLVRGFGFNGALSVELVRKGSFKKHVTHHCVQEALAKGLLRKGSFRKACAKELDRMSPFLP